jgi:putative Mg2+ transporter-C (MgtC) family protein
MKWLTGSWNEFIPAPWATVTLALVAILCGAIVGIERDKKEKPVGFRTLTLVSLGAAVFTMMSLKLGDKDDPTRIAAPIISGIGFLCAGVILRGRFGVVGLTSAATVWVMAAAGMVVGAGYAGAGFALSVLILMVITIVAALEQQYIGPCAYVTCIVKFGSNGGKTAIQLNEILDEYNLPWGERESALENIGDEELRIRYCCVHKHHREFLSRIVEIPEVHEIIREEPARA